MKTSYLLLSLLLLSCYNLTGQESTPITKAVILSVEEDRVFLDLGEGKINVGDRLQVIRDRGFFTHPVTGEQIARDPEIVAYIQITDVRLNYSEGMVSPRNAMSMLEAGMEALVLVGEDRDNREFRKSIAVQPLNVSSAIGGYLGIYIADLLTEELFNIDQFRVIDRESLGWQMDEIALATQGIVDEKEAIRIGKTRGVDYFITGTMYEPDVVDMSTGVPLKGIVGAAEAIAGRSLGSGLVSDVSYSQLRAIVNISLRVVDVETGEILFITSEMQQATGRGEINLEQGVLGGMQLRGGTTSFLNTITGQATKAALNNLAGYLNGYFDGTIDVRNFRGNTIDIGRVGTRSERREERREDREDKRVITRENWENYRQEIVESEGSRIATIIDLEFIEPRRRWSQQSFKVGLDKGRLADFRRGGTYYLFEPMYSLDDNPILTGYNRIGELIIENADDNYSSGTLTLDSGVIKPTDYYFPIEVVSFLKP